MVPPTRSSFAAFDIVKHIWTVLNLPPDALNSLRLEGTGLGLPSSFKVGPLAHASIGLSGLASSLLHAQRNRSQVQTVTVPLQNAVIEFKSEHLYLLNGEKPPSSWGPISGLYKTSDGYVRVHANFPNHHNGTLELLGCPKDAEKTEVSRAISTWRSVDLETAAANNKLVISALRSFAEWDITPQAKAVSDFPITIRKIAEGSPGLPDRSAPGNDKCLRNLRVLEMSRVIAAPVAGKTLAAHGADVLWVTSPNLPDLPALDKDVGRGKRTAQFDLNQPGEVECLLDLMDHADVFLQSYRPGSLAAKGLDAENILARRKGRPIVIANLSAYGTSGSWANRRGFDSLVQTCSGINVSEAEHYGEGEFARVLPCQALDHASGYFLATGVMAALYKQATEGGSYSVEVTLAGTMRYLRSLGQYEGKTGFAADNYKSFEDVPPEFTETRDSAFGKLQSIKHSVSIDRLEVGWDIMPKPLGSDKAVWL